jgi:hypothetical protein
MSRAKRGIAPAVVDDLRQARIHARDLGLALTRANASAIPRGLDSTLRLARGLDNNLGDTCLNLDGARETARTIARALARDIKFDLNGMPIRVSLSRDARSINVGGVQINNYGPTQASTTHVNVCGTSIDLSNLCNSFELARKSASKLATTLDRAITSTAVAARVQPEAEQVIPSREAQRVIPSAADLLVVATRLLPIADRVRYFEEYFSELWELAQAGHGRARQLRYALRQLLNAIPMGLALRSPRRRGAAP